METVISDAPPSQSAIAAVKDKHEAEMGMSKVLFLDSCCRPRFGKEQSAPKLDFAEEVS
jgi:hypothetical protein